LKLRVSGSGNAERKNNKKAKESIKAVEGKEANT